MIPANFRTYLDVVDRFVVQGQRGTVKLRSFANRKAERGAGAAAVSVPQEILAERQFNFVSEVVHQPCAGRIPFRIVLRDAVGKEGVVFMTVIQLDISSELVRDLAGGDEVNALTPVPRVPRLFRPAVTYHGEGGIGIERISDTAHI